VSSPKRFPSKIIIIITCHVYRTSFNFRIMLRAQALLTIPDSTSLKFILPGQIACKDQTANTGRIVVVFLDFAATRSRQCEDQDFEK